jgi:DNA (cytosine-5)-methyltransferase 1
MRRPIITMEKEEFKTLDLFAGIGGIRLGFENAGFKTIFANDFDKNCKITYDLNFNEPKLLVEDIWKINIDKLPEFDILLGGFPCQAFSIAGYKKGFKDDKGRGNLFFRIA